VNSFSADASRRGASMRVDLSPDLPLVTVDPLRMREVFSNLLANSLHHTQPGGRVTMAIGAVANKIVVTVGDTGPGIAPEDLPKIFDRFFKGKTSRGSGIGLTVARDLVVAHGGTIRAESRAGEGTTFTVTLPVA
jgi:signal transduction histidine kinase